MVLTLSRSAANKRLFWPFFFRGDTYLRDLTRAYTRRFCSYAASFCLFFPSSSCFRTRRYVHLFFFLLRRALGLCGFGSVPEPENEHATSSRFSFFFFFSFLD